LAGLESTATSGALNSGGKGAVRAGPTTSVRVHTRQAVIETGAPSPIRRRVIAAAGGVVGVEQIVGVTEVAIVAVSIVIVSCLGGTADPLAGLGVVGERIVVACLPRGTA